MNLDFFNHTKQDYIYDYRVNIKKQTIFSKKFGTLFKDYSPHKMEDDFKADLAASAQKVFEFFLLKIFDYIKKNFDYKNLVFAGGCALNSKANRLIYEKKYFENIFIPYAPGDGGGSIGAALYINNIKYKNKCNNLKSPYLGSDYNDIDFKKIKNKLENHKCSTKFYVQKDQDYYDDISKLLSEKKIVGFFNGKIEFGARALGNRSILADPSNPDVKNLINEKIKKRESFRPFAPSILFEEKKYWFNNDLDNPYMSLIEKIKTEKKEIVPGVVHVDDTCRLQTVTRKNNEVFYNLLSAFKNLTGIPMLLNTSFNENEPIVNSPDDAINCFVRTDMDALIIENIMIKKKV